MPSLIRLGGSFDGSAVVSSVYHLGLCLLIQ